MDMYLSQVLLGLLSDIVNWYLFASHCNRIGRFAVRVLCLHLVCSLLNWTIVETCGLSQGDDVRGKVKARLHVSGGRSRSDAGKCATCGTHVSQLRDEALSSITPVTPTSGGGQQQAAPTLNRHTSQHQHQEEKEDATAGCCDSATPHKRHAVGCGWGQESSRQRLAGEYTSICH